MPGGLLCCFYESRMEQFQVVLPFLAEGLARGEKCLYMADESTVAEIKAGLFIRGVDVTAYLKSGQLTILTGRDYDTQLGRFDPHRMLSFITSFVKEALREGYQGVRNACEATWVLRNLGDMDPFFEYEAMQNVAVAALPFKSLWQYDAKRFFGDVLVKVLRTHPRVLLGLDLYENPSDET